jgi:hypothetical protein
MTVLDPAFELRLHRLTGAFLAGYRNANTRSSYLQHIAAVRRRHGTRPHARRG